MGRPRSFDEDTALDAALDLFWSKGYEATSITDLTEAMGIQRGSLYQAFGDKKTLFLTALERYLAAGRAQCEALLAEKDSAIQGLMAWCEKSLTGCPSRKGCFAVNTTVELAPHDKDIAKVTAKHWAEVEEILTRVVKEGQSQGELRSDAAPEAVARMLISCLAGTQVLDKQRSRRDLTPSAFSALVEGLIKR